MTIELETQADAWLAQARAKECADAQERYKKLIEGRRIYKTGDNGERVSFVLDWHVLGWAFVASLAGTARQGKAVHRRLAVC